MIKPIFNYIQAKLLNLLYCSYAIKIRFFRNLIINAVVKLEGGEEFSLTLRRIFVDYHDIHIGLYTYGGCFSPNCIPRGTVIGRYCSIAQNLRVLNGNHPVENLSTHPFFFNSYYKYLSADTIRRTKLVIGNDVWIGFNVIILPSAKVIGDGAVIGAGSVVTKDVPPFSVVAGNPAKLIRNRFSSETAGTILRSPWWNKSIEENIEKIEMFLKPVEGSENENA